MTARLSTRSHCHDPQQLHACKEQTAGVHTWSEPALLDNSHWHINSSAKQNKTAQEETAALKFVCMCMASTPGKVLVPEALRLAVAVLMDQIGSVHDHSQAPVELHQEGLAVMHAVLEWTPRLVDDPWPARCNLLHPRHAVHHECSLSLPREASCGIRASCTL